MGRAKTTSGAPACFLSGISGWRDGSLYPLARGCRRIWRGEVWLRRRDALRYGVSFATTRSQQLAEGAALTPFLPLYAREGADGQAVVCPLLRGSSPTRWVAPKQHQGLRRAFPLS